MTSPTVPIAFRVRPEVKAKLREQADADCRTLSSMLTKIMVERYPDLRRKIKTEEVRSA